MSHVSKIRPAWVSTHRRLEDDLLERLARQEAVQTIVRRRSQFRIRLTALALAFATVLVAVGCAIR